MHCRTHPRRSLFSMWKDRSRESARSAATLTKSRGTQAASHAGSRPAFPDLNAPAFPRGPSWHGPEALSEPERRQLEEWLRAQPAAPSRGPQPVAPLPTTPAAPQIEASDRRRPRHRQRQVPSIDVSENPEWQDRRRRDPCSFDYPDMVRCADSLGRTHDSLEDAFQEAIRDLGRDALRPDGTQLRFTTRGVEASNNISHGQHQTWWSEDGRIKISAGCTTCCENVPIGTAAYGSSMLSARPRLRCNVLNVVPFP